MADRRPARILRYNRVLVLSYYTLATFFSQLSSSEAGSSPCPVTTSSRSFTTPSPVREKEKERRTKDEWGSIHALTWFRKEDRVSGVYSAYPSNSLNLDRGVPEQARFRLSLLFFEVMGNTHVHISHGTACRTSWVQHIGLVTSYQQPWRLRDRENIPPRRAFDDEVTTRDCKCPIGVLDSRSPQGSLSVGHARGRGRRSPDNNAPPKVQNRALRTADSPLVSPTSPVSASLTTPSPLVSPAIPVSAEFTSPSPFASPASGAVLGRGTGEKVASPEPKKGEGAGVRARGTGTRERFQGRGEKRSVKRSGLPGWWWRRVGTERGTVTSKDAWRTICAVEG